MMSKAGDLLDAFDASLSDAPGGYTRALQWWEQIYDSLPDANWDTAATHLNLDRRGCIALMRYALAKKDGALARTVALIGMIHEGQWVKPLTRDN